MASMEPSMLTCCACCDWCETRPPSGQGADGKSCCAMLCLPLRDWTVCVSPSAGELLDLVHAHLHASKDVMKLRSGVALTVGIAIAKGALPAVRRGALGFLFALLAHRSDGGR